jgi:hypothetical protein
VDIPWEPAGYEQNATGGVTSFGVPSCVRNSVVMEWIEHGYALRWTTAAPTAREMRNAESALQHSRFRLGCGVRDAGKNLCYQSASGRKANGR